MATKHGYSKTRLYRIWNGMKQRCNNPNSSSYERYGGRGIKICEEWSDFLVFREWALAHGYDGTLTIDREDNDGDYCPENCRWLTIQENVSRSHYERTIESYKKAFIGSRDWWNEKIDITEYAKRVDYINEFLEATKGLTAPQMYSVLQFINWIKASHEAHLRKLEYDKKMR